MKTNTKKLVVLAAMSALSVVLVMLVHFPIIPALSFLEYDPADIPVLICGFLFGPGAGLAVTVIVSLVQGLTVSAASGMYGIIMHVIATGVNVLTTSLIYRSHKTHKGAMVALASGVVAMTLVMGGANLVITPIFMGVTVSAVAGMLPLILLFNLIKAGVNAVLTALVYKRISRFVHKWEEK